jgi:hypothetical protein
MEEGFKIIPNITRRFGNGIYFSDKQDTSYYGEHMISANIECQALSLTAEQWSPLEDNLIRKYENDYSKHIAAYLENRGYNALIIEFHSGKELVVFDPSAIIIN